MMSGFMSYYRTYYSHVATQNIQKTILGSSYQINTFNNIIDYIQVYGKKIIPSGVFVLCTLELYSDRVKDKFRIMNKNNQVYQNTLTNFLSDMNSISPIQWIIDIFIDNKKYNIKDINVIYFNGNLFLDLSSPDCYIYRRKYIKDWFTENGVIYLDESEMELFTSNFPVYFNDGVFSNNSYTILKNNDGYEIDLNNNGNPGEIVLFPNGTSLHSFNSLIDWVDLNPDATQTYNQEGLIIFKNGTIIDPMSVKLVSNSLLDISSINKTTSTSGYIIAPYFNSTSIEETKDYISWFKEHELKSENTIAGLLNDGTAPDFISEYKNYTVNTIYNMSNVDNIKNLITYDVEFFKKFINYSIEKYISPYTTSYYINNDNHPYSEWLFNDTSSMPYNNDIEFDSPMLLLVMENINKNPFKVYVNGVFVYEIMEYYNEAGYDYIYLDYDNMSETDNIEVEYYTNLSDDIIKSKIVSNSTGTLNLGELVEPAKIYGDNITIYKEVINDGVVTYNEISDYELDLSCGEIYLGEEYADSVFCVVIESSILYYEYTIHERSVISNVTFTINSDDFKTTKQSIYNYRLYKDGLYIPHSSYTLTFNTNGSITVSTSCSAYMSETFILEYNPIPLCEVYSEETINSYGIINPDLSDISYPLNMKMQYIYLNGRKLIPSQIEEFSSNCITLSNVYSTNNFVVLMNNDYENITNFSTFTTNFQSATSLFMDYRNSQAVGSPISNTQTNELTQNPNVMRTLYWDLYNDYLKDNIVNFGYGGVPDYIAIKYQNLVNENNIILIDCGEQMNHWMPLDANMSSSEMLDSMLSLYNNLLNKISSESIITPQLPDNLITEAYPVLQGKENSVFVFDIGQIIQPVDKLDSPL